MLYQVAPYWTINDRDREADTEYREDYEKNVQLKLWGNG